MDINAALERMRYLASQVSGIDTDDLSEVDIQDLANMAIVWESIDGWLSKGGFKPAAWS